ncbi:MAG: hypothetical protein J6S75_01945 [Thermoguttaceae bacterium]|nr:hypothetical protein [Thermoguttaceae bacterium]
MSTPQNPRLKPLFPQLKEINGSIAEAEAVGQEALKTLTEAVRALNDHLTTKQRILDELSDISPSIVSSMIVRYKNILEDIEERLKNSNITDCETIMVLTSCTKACIGKEIDHWKSRDNIVANGYKEITNKRNDLAHALKVHFDAIANDISIK